MKKQKEIEEIKKLIQSGFDLKLISFELDIPMQELIQYKIDIETSKINNAENTVHSKMNEMRGRYKSLYFRSNKVEVAKPKELSEEELKLVQTVIKTVEEKIKAIRTVARKNRKYIASTILPELKKIEGFQLPMEHAEQLYMLLHAEELDALNTSVVDRVDYYISNERRRSLNNYAKAIEFEQYKVNDIESLKVLERRITGDMVKEAPLTAGTVKSKISSRISAIQQQDVKERIRSEIPVSIMHIIQGLANGNIDIVKANKVINEEAKKRVESKPKTMFSLTEEQERRQILIQIRTAISEKTDTFYIINPEKTILQMQELCGGELRQAIRAVVENLIKYKDYEVAKNICDKFSKKDEDKESEHTKYITGLRNEIRNAEISDIVMKAINMNGTPEEESACFSLIEKGLKMGNINLRAISLGKSEDGIKNITLADIWCDDKQKHR